MMDRFVIEGVSYSKASLIDHSKRMCNDAGIPEWKRKVFQFCDLWFSMDPTIKVRTSGSTGVPKELALRKERMRASAKRSIDYFNLNSGNTALLALPIENIAGMMMVVRALEGGLDLRMISPQQIDLTSIQQAVDFTALVPLQVERMLNSPNSMEKVRAVIVGGASMSHRVREALKSSFAGKVWETYGMTEAITHVAVRDVKRTVMDDPYLALPHVEFSKDERGCLVIDDPISGAEGLVTNDLVELINPQSFRLLGRFDNIINTGGVKVSPEVVEAQLQSFIDGEFCVSSLPNESLGEMLALVVEANTVITRLNEGLATLPKYHQPKKVVTIPEIPYNPNGKVNRLKVRNMIR